MSIREQATAKQIEEVIYTWHARKRNGARYIPSPPGEKVRMRGHKGIVESRQHRYAFLSRGEEKNLLANEMSLQILGGGQLCGSNELTPTRISKFAGSLRNSALPLGEGQTKSGGHSPLLHSGCPLQPNMLRSVIPQQFRCIPEGVGALRYLYWGTFNATGFV